MSFEALITPRTDILMSKRSTIVRHLIAEHGSSAVAYFYFDFKDRHKQAVLSLLASWISQIVRSIRPLPDVLTDLYQRHDIRDQKSPTPPTEYELIQILNAVKKSTTPLFLVVDALDECDQRPMLLETLATLFKDGDRNCRILCSSRIESDLESTFRDLSVMETCIQKEDVDRDVALHIRAVMDSDARLIGHRQSIKDHIERELTCGAKGM